MEMRGKSAIIYGGSRGMGAAVARTFASEGAAVFLAGRDREALESVASEIRRTGGIAHVAAVDPLSPKAVEAHVSDVVNEWGTVDLSFNLAFLGVEMSPKLTGASDQEFAASALTRVRSNFVTCIAAAREMAYQGSGTILAASRSSDGIPGPDLGSLVIGGAAIEAFCHELGRELAPRGVRVACLGLGRSSDPPMLDGVFQVLAGGRPASLTMTGGREGTAPARPPLLATPSRLGSALA